MSERKEQIRRMLEIVNAKDIADAIYAEVVKPLEEALDWIAYEAVMSKAANMDHLCRMMKQKAKDALGIEEAQS